MPQALIELIDELITSQEKKLLKMGRELVPNLTSDDLLQPMDYPQLEQNPIFRHEEGILEGFRTVRFALVREGGSRA